MTRLNSVPCCSPTYTWWKLAQINPCQQTCNKIYFSSVSHIYNIWLYIIHTYQFYTHLLGIYNNTVSKVSFARFNVTEFYWLESTIIKVYMAEYHFSKPENIKKLRDISCCIFNCRICSLIVTSERRSYLQLKNVESLYWRFSQEPLNVVPLKSILWICSVCASYSIARKSFRYSGHHTIRP